MAPSTAQSISAVVHAGSYLTAARASRSASVLARSSASGSAVGSGSASYRGSSGACWVSYAAAAWVRCPPDVGRYLVARRVLTALGANVWENMVPVERPPVRPREERCMAVVLLNPGCRRG